MGKVSYSLYLFNLFKSGRFIELKFFLFKSIYRWRVDETYTFSATFVVFAAKSHHAVFDLEFGNLLLMKSSLAGAFLTRVIHRIQLRIKCVRCVRMRCAAFVLRNVDRIGLTNENPRYSSTFIRINDNKCASIFYTSFFFDKNNKLKKWYKLRNPFWAEFRRNRAGAINRIIFH